MSKQQPKELTKKEFEKLISDSAEHHKKYMAEKEPLTVNYDPLLAAPYVKAHAEGLDQLGKPQKPEEHKQRALTASGFLRKRIRKD